MVTFLVFVSWSTSRRKMKLHRGLKAHLMLYRMDIERLNWVNLKNASARMWCWPMKTVMLSLINQLQSRKIVQITNDDASLLLANYKLDFKRVYKYVVDLWNFNRYRKMKMMFIGWWYRRHWRLDDWILTVYCLYRQFISLFVSIISHLLDPGVMEAYWAHNQLI